MIVSSNFRFIPKPWSTPIPNFTEAFAEAVRPKRIAVASEKDNFLFISKPYYFTHLSVINKIMLIAFNLTTLYSSYLEFKLLLSAGDVVYP
ncbi:hypothetical protein VIN01S_22970 [Vibrio inusitatus NBRC 102082]|uniref:Uncharacterized protein n=1 Tax=Vibrio inusitatus NBRC 102082 TaxID=1219070 RepID=A0A4Y3HWD0_9VIBR|nr:hypothetical protein VIN01S_22970 [Vibrio inusitatus NBRC 102082]